jgi:hypothetical protein
LLAIGLVSAAPPGAHAAKIVDIIVEQNNCLAECSQDTKACTTACCSRLLCRSSCVDACNSNLNICNADCSTFCSTCSPDSAFFDTATISGDGRLVNVGGPLVCPESATADLDVTLTQKGTGAVATGHVRAQCPPSETTFAVAVQTTGSTSFLPLSKVQACGTAWIHGANLSLDSFQWCREITLVPAGFQLEE